MGRAVVCLFPEQVSGNVHQLDEILEIYRAIDKMMASDYATAFHR